MSGGWELLWMTVTHAQALPILIFKNFPEWGFYSSTAFKTFRPTKHFLKVKAVNSFDTAVSLVRSIGAWSEKALVRNSPTSRYRK